jgi:uncharacterized protein
VGDIFAELKKPGRDPRQRFEAVQFKEGVHKPEDLEIGMELQGIVTNVTDFGAFVDVGVHQDGLVHLSEISHTFVKNPSQALSVGQAVRVKVLAVDLKSKRIGLSIKALLPGAPQRPHQPRPEPRPAQDRPPRRPEGPRPPRPEGQRPRPEGGHKSRPRNEEPRRMEHKSEPPRKPEVKGASMDDLLARFNKGIR